jgi:hypothetical protein
MSAIAIEQFDRSVLSVARDGTWARRDFVLGAVGRGLAAAARVVKQLPARGAAHPCSYTLRVTARRLIDRRRRIVRVWYGSVSAS